MDEDENNVLTGLFQGAGKADKDKKDKQEQSNNIEGILNGTAGVLNAGANLADTFTGNGNNSNQPLPNTPTSQSTPPRWALPVGLGLVAAFIIGLLIYSNQNGKSTPTTPK
jgi:hypothetical protein